MFEHEVSREGPICPYCLTQWTADDASMYSEDGYTQDECGACGETFNVQVCIETTWTTERIE